jgi:hypothetical protein
MQTQYDFNHNNRLQSLRHAHYILGDILRYFRDVRHYGKYINEEETYAANVIEHARWYIVNEIIRFVCYSHEVEVEIAMEMKAEAI